MQNLTILALAIPAINKGPKI